MKTRIKELRQENQFTQELLANKIGVTQAALSRIERELSIPDAELLIRLSGIFHVSVDYLLLLSDQRTGSKHNMKHIQDIISSLPDFSARQRFHLQNFLESIACN